MNVLALMWSMLDRHDVLGQRLFVVDQHDHPLSKPIELIDQQWSLHDSSGLHLATFRKDQNTHEKIRLTSEQHLIAMQQAYSSSTQLATYVLDKHGAIISESIQALDRVAQGKHSVEETSIRDLQRWNEERDRLASETMSREDTSRLADGVSTEYALMQDRLDQIKTDEKVIEYILPLLGKVLRLTIADQSRYFYY